MGLKYESFELQTSRLKLSGFSANENSTGSPIIAIHGWLDNAASFIPLSEYLNTGRPFYAVELPGHGNSEHRPQNTAYHLVDNVVDIVAFIESVLQRHAAKNELSKKEVTLVGHSLGGIIASFVAATSPQYVKNLILLDSLGPLTDDLQNVLPQLRKAVAKASAVRMTKKTVFPSFEKAVRARMMGIGRVTQEAATFLCERGLRKEEGGYVWVSDSRLLEPSFVRFNEAQVEVIFSGIECPVFVIRGDQGYFATYDAIKKRLGYFKNIKQYTVSGGHHFHMDGDVEETSKLLDEIFSETTNK